MRGWQAVVEGATILVFADDWGGHPSSAQHLFRRFLAKNRVVWFNTVGLRWPRPTLYDLRKVFRKIRHWTSSLNHNPVTRPEVHEIPLLPLQLGRPARKWNARILGRAVDNCLSRLSEPSALFIVSTLPLTADLVRVVPGAIFIYYLVDDYASWPGLTGQITRQMDQEQARKADRVIAASQALATLHRNIATTVDYLPHGVDVDHFATGRDVRSRRKTAGDKALADVVFFGALDERIDQELFNAIIQARPNLRFLCIGPKTGSRDRLKPAANLERRPAVPFADLSTLLGQCEVALLPYTQGELGQRLAPLKALEALTAGLPVVGTDIPELRQLPCGALLGTNLAEVLASLDQALDAPPRLPSLQDLATESWDNRAERLSQIMISANAAHAHS